MHVVFINKILKSLKLDTHIVELCQVLKTPYIFLRIINYNCDQRLFLLVRNVHKYLVAIRQRKVQHQHPEHYCMSGTEEG